MENRKMDDTGQHKCDESIFCASTRKTSQLTDMREISLGEREEVEENQLKLRRVQRHNRKQIRALEEYFGECQHPDAEQRKELSNRLCLTPTQVKFWFQNKRTQIKALQDRNETQRLRKVNEKLLKELRRIKNENAKEEREAFLTEFRTEDLSASSFFEEFSLLPTDILKENVARTYALAAMENLLLMAQYPSHFWTENSLDNSEMLNAQWYDSYFGNRYNKANCRLNLRTEASRKSIIVNMKSRLIAETLVNKDWEVVFPSIVSKSRRVQIAAGVSGALQLIHGEVHGLSPVLPARQYQFLRHCCQTADNCWIVVDASLDALNYDSQSLPSFLRCPSGCIISDETNGLSKVTWVEHIEIAHKEDVNESHQSESPNFHSHFTVYGADRWLSALKFFCEIESSLNYSRIPFHRVQSDDFCHEGRVGLMMLSQKMTHLFSAAAAASVSHGWNVIYSDPESTLRLAMKKIGQRHMASNGFHLNAIESFLIPVNSFHLFEFLSDREMRHQWDRFCKGPVQHIKTLVNGAPENGSIQLFRMNKNHPTGKLEIVLQESRRDDFGSMVLYSMVNVPALDVVIRAQGSYRLPLCPSGFVIIPFSQSASLLTISLQIELGGHITSLKKYHLQVMSRLTKERVHSICKALNVSALQRKRLFLKNGYYCVS